MRERLEDNLEDEKYWRKKKGRERKKLEDIVGSKNMMYKKFINKLIYLMTTRRGIIRKDNEEKIRKLKAKIRRDEFKLPKNLSRYKDVGAFASEQEITPEPLRGLLLLVIEILTSLMVRRKS
jgi:hypothetical protein